MNMANATTNANAKENTMRKTTKKTTTETYEWLMAKTRLGRRIERLGWKRLARIYYAAKPGSKIRKAINAEARRCGYTPKTILSIHAE